ncbi:39S ribosomal protein L14, mitochondrial, partial [Trichinella sp. T6]
LCDFCKFVKMHPSDISKLAVIIVVGGMVASAMFTLLPTAYPEHFGFVKMTKENNNSEQCVDDNVRVELFQIFVRLTGADKKDRLTGDVSHGNGGADFVVDCVEFGEHNSVDRRILLVDGGAVDQSSAEFLQLVDRLVADQRLADEQHQVGLVDSDQLAQGAHQGLVVLHPAGRVHQHHVQVVRLGVAYGRSGDRGRILTVTLFVQLHQTRMEFIQVADVGAELFDRPGAERVAGGNKHPEAVLVEPKCHLGQVGRLADAVDTAKDDTVATRRFSGLENVAQQAAVPLGLEQQLYQALPERIPDHAGDQAELTDHTAPQAGANRLAQLVGHFGSHIFPNQLFLHLFQRPEQQVVGQRLVANQTLKSRQKTTTALFLVVGRRAVELLLTTGHRSFVVLFLVQVVVVTQTTQFTTHLAHVTSLLFNRRSVQQWIHCRPRPCCRIAGIGLTATEIQLVHVVELGISAKFIPTAILFDLFAFRSQIRRQFAARTTTRFLLFRLGSFQKILTHFCQLRLHHHRRAAVLHGRVRIQFCWNTTRRHWHCRIYIFAVASGVVLLLILLLTSINKQRGVSFRFVRLFERAHRFCRQVVKYRQHVGKIITVASLQQGATVPQYQIVLLGKDVGEFGQKFIRIADRRNTRISQQIDELEFVVQAQVEREIAVLVHRLVHSFVQHDRFQNCVDAGAELFRRRFDVPQHDASFGENAQMFNHFSNRSDRRQRGKKQKMLYSTMMMPLFHRLFLPKRQFSTTSLLNWIHLKTRFRVVDNSDLGKQAMLGGKPPYCIRVYRQGRLGKAANRGQLGDKILVAIKGELRRAYIVGWKAHHSQIRHGVPRSDSNNIVLLDANENLLGNKVLVPVPAWLQSKPDLAKIVQSASKVV